MQREEALLLLQNPDAAPEQLATICEVFPDLRAQVAVHPALYPELGRWLASLGDPQVDAALATRSATAQVPQAPPATMPPTPVAPKVQAPAVKTPPSGKASQKKGLIIAVVSAVVTLAVLGGVYWFFKGGNGLAVGLDSAAELGSESAVSAGEKLAAKLADNDEAITSQQTVAGPGLFYYGSSEEDVDFTDEDAPYLTNQVIVKVSPNTDLETVRDIAKSADASLVGVNAFTHSYQLLLNERHSADALPSVIDTLQTEASVVAVEPNYLTRVEPTSSEDEGNEWAGQWGSTLGEDNWGMQAIGAPTIWDSELELDEVVVGVLAFFEGDQWHSDLPELNDSDRFVPKEAEETGATSGHSGSSSGLHVAGTIAAVEDGGVRGVAPNVALLVASPHEIPYQGPSAGDAGEEAVLVDSYSLEEALTFLVERNAEIIDISLQEALRYGPNAFEVRTSDALQPEAAEQVYADALRGALTTEDGETRDVLVVKAAGGEACTAAQVEETERDCGSPDEPGCAEDERCWATGAPDYADPQAGGLPARLAGDDLSSNLLTVGAAGKQDYLSSQTGSEDLALQVAPFSNAGVDVLAPGTSIRSTVATSGDGEAAPDSYAVWDGTSMAAAHVSGMAAVLLGINPDLTSEQLKAIIVETANHTPLLYWNSSGEAEDAADLAGEAPLINAAAATQIALLTKEAEGDSVLERLRDGEYTLADGSSMPTQLVGTWCLPEAMGGDASYDACVNLGTLLEDGKVQFGTENQDTVLRALDETGRTTTAATFELLGEDGAQYLLTYYPPGAQWECLDEGDTCPTDVSSVEGDHDVSYPRIVQTYAEVGSGEVTQSLPYALNLSVPVDAWGSYDLVPFEEGEEVSLEVLAEGGSSTVPAQLRGTWCTDSLAGYPAEDAGMTQCVNFEEWLAGNSQRSARAIAADGSWSEPLYEIPDPGNDGQFITCEAGAPNLYCLNWYFMAAGVERDCADPIVSSGPVDPDGAGTSALACIENPVPGEEQRDRLRLHWDMRGWSVPDHMGPVYFRQD